jgi:hypothetical protein
MLEVIIIILASIGFIFLVSVAVAFVLPKLKSKKQDKFEENYFGLLVNKNKELIRSLKFLIEESLELVKEVENDEDFQNAVLQGKKVSESLDDAFNEIMQGTREESIINLTILEGQLNAMTEKVYKDIMLIEQKLGIERILH